MKSRIHPYDRLNKKEKDEISKVVIEEAMKVTNARLKVFLKIILISMNESLGIGTIRANRFLQELIKNLMKFRYWEKDGVEIELLEKRYRQTLKDIDMTGLQDDECEGGDDGK